MCFHPRLQPLIMQKGYFAGNKAQWIRFKGLEGGHLEILNFYASNMVNERIAMWQEFLHHLPTNCKWITTGDFNMMESSLDRSTPPCSNFMRLNEELACGGGRGV